MCHWAEEETDQRENTEAQVYEQAELCHIFRKKLAVQFLLCLGSPLHCANEWHSLIFKLIYNTGQIMVDGDR